MKNIKPLLADRIRANREKLSRWCMEKAQIAPPPFYCSVDLRDAGYKIAPVDSNLFPAGFNNICPEDIRTAPTLIRAQVEAEMNRRMKDLPTRVLIIPEAHTTNRFYIENLYYLEKLFKEAGFETCIGWYQPQTEAPLSEDAITLISATEKELKAYPIRREGSRIKAAQFDPDVIILNNDFSSGHPAILDQIDQPVLPTHRLGWFARKKSTHCVHYNRLASEFASIIGIDPWHITIESVEVNEVNFSESIGLDRVESAVGQMLKNIHRQYELHNVSRKPFVFVKNNSGTYGMGIMVVRDPQEIATMNRRSKNKMSVGKNKLQIESVVVQEGIPTATIVDRLASEPVIYLSGTDLIGGFLRTNTERGDEDNLNSQGMVFKTLCMTDLRETTWDLGSRPVDQTTGSEIGDELAEAELDHDPSLELVYGSIARISALAAGLEMLEATKTFG